MFNRIAVILPIYGQDHLTTSVLADIDWERHKYHREMEVSIFLVDNKGDYKPKTSITKHIKPGSNLRWTKGTNAGLQVASSPYYTFDYFVCLNNDVSLSHGFLQGFMEAFAEHPLCGLMGPLYDDVHEHQRGPYRGPAWDFQGTPVETTERFIDGTCMVIPRNTLEAVGWLDAEHFGEYGWGADFDYSYRVREAGASVMVTRRSYLNHFHQGTAKTESDNWNGIAGNEMEAGMTKKYGANWRTFIL